jgi:hypothetical protein
MTGENAKKEIFHVHGRLDWCSYEVEEDCRPGEVSDFDQHCRIVLLVRQVANEIAAEGGVRRREPSCVLETGLRTYGGSEPKEGGPSGLQNGWDLKELV